MLTRDSIDKFLTESGCQGIATNSLRAYGADLRLFFSFRESVELADLNKVASLWLSESDCSPATLRRRIATIRKFGKWAGLEAVLPTYKAPPRPKQVPHPLPGLANSLNRLLEACNNDIERRLIALCGLAGLRVEEAVSFDSTCIDWRYNRLRILGKGTKIRFVPISTRLAEYLRGVDGRLVPWSNQHARRKVTEIGVNAGLGHIASHDLRATFATVVYDQTKNIRIVQELLGHSSSATTDIYVGVSQSEMHKAVNF